MDDLYTRDLDNQDIPKLIEGMRDPDIAEVIAMSGPNIALTLERAVSASTDCWAVDHRDGLYMLCGVAPVSLIGGIGCPWMLGTTLIDQSPKPLMGVSVPYRERMEKSYPMLVNYVDARNTRSIRWLSRIGFTIHDPILTGWENRPSHRFDRGFH